MDLACLPDDELERIVSFLPLVRDRISLSGTCKALRAACRRRQWCPCLTIALPETSTAAAELGACLRGMQVPCHLTCDAYPLLFPKYGDKETLGARLGALSGAPIFSLDISPHADTRGYGCPWCLPLELGQLTQLTRLMMHSFSGTWQEPEAAVRQRKRSGHADAWEPAGMLRALAPSLRHLELISSANNLYFPPALSALTLLTHLGLPRYGASARGMEHIAALTQLQSLDLRDSCLITLGQPEPAAGVPVLEALVQLRRLDLSSCSGLHALPASLSALTLLTELVLLDNWLEQVADSWQHLQHLQHLRVLRMSGCRMRAVPAVFSQLSACTALQLSRNTIDAGWNCLPPRLARLEMRSNKLLGMPDLSYLAATLTHLDAAGNPNLKYGGALSPVLATLRRLRWLNLSSCSLKEAPLALTLLTNLTSLCLADNHGIHQPSLQRIAALRRLRQLDLGSCGLAEVPPGLPRQLIRLSLAHNHLGCGGSGQWQRLLPLRQLQELELSDCMLQALPAALAHLPGSLTALHLGSNRLHNNSSLAHLQPLTHLRQLSLPGCGLPITEDHLVTFSFLDHLDVADSWVPYGWEGLCPRALLAKARRLAIARELAAADGCAVP